jgi:hypothetical protein
MNRDSPRGMRINVRLNRTSAFQTNSVRQVAELLLDLAVQGVELLLYRVLALRRRLENTSMSDEHTQNLTE